MKIINKEIKSNETTFAPELHMTIAFPMELTKDSIKTNSKEVLLKEISDLLQKELGIE